MHPSFWGKDQLKRVRSVDCKRMNILLPHLVAASTAIIYSCDKHNLFSSEFHWFSESILTLLTKLPKKRMAYASMFENDDPLNYRKINPRPFTELATIFRVELDKLYIKANNLPGNQKL